MRPRKSRGRKIAPSWGMTTRICPKKGTDKGSNRAIMVLEFCRRLRYQPHMAKETIENLARTLAETLPESLKSMQKDVEKNFRAVLESSLARLDLVTREDFEVQEAILLRTRRKLDALEQKVAALEAESKTAGKSD
jgi:BMFP domain-containing protein YqiC